MTWTYTPEYYKQYTRDTWDESAPAYDRVRRQLDQWTPDLLAVAEPRPGDRVLDVATGPGEPALSLAPLVAPGGHVLGGDLSERMVELARENAKLRRVANAEFRVMDAEAIDLPDASVDLVTCRFGLQIFTDPDLALAQMRRVLKPGGRLALSVWGPGERVPAIHVLVGPMLEHAEPDETGYIPTPYEMGGDGELVALLEKTGFRDARERRVVREWRWRDEEDYFEATLKGTPLGHSLGEEDEDVQRAVLRKTRENLAKYRTPEGLVLPAEAVIASARK